jgi:ketosteroid isomerase-like protein
MRKVLLLTACSVALASSVFAQSTPNARVEQEIREATLKLTAVYKNNLPAYFSQYADDTIMWWPQGRVDKAGYQKATANRPDFEVCEASDIRVQVSPAGDAAVSSYLLTLKDGRPNSVLRNTQMTLVWFLRDGKWQVVHLHHAPPNPPRPSPQQ